MSTIHGAKERVLSSPVMHFHPTSTLNDLDCTQSLIAEAANAEQQLRKLINSNGLLGTGVQELFCRARASYMKIILSDLPLEEIQDIEYSLWKLHYKQIDEYRNRIRESSATKECKNTTTVQNATIVRQNSKILLEGFETFLSEATEFYQDLLVKIRRSHGLAGEVMFFNDGALSNSVDLTKMSRCQFACHRCLICLGDLARYMELYGNPDTRNRNWSEAATHYLNASMIWPDSGNPQNQLALLAIYVGDELLALYHCIRSLAVKEPFPDAWNNLNLLFEKNGASHLHSITNEATFNFFKPSESKSASSNSFSNGQMEEAAGDVLPERTSLWSLFVRMISFFYVESSLQDFPCIFGCTIRELEGLLSLEDARLKAALEPYQRMGMARTGPFRVLQIVSVLIFTIHMLTESSKLRNPAHIKYIQQPSLILLALASTFICMGRLVNRCLLANLVTSSPLLPAILVFVEWLMDFLSTAEKYVTDEKCASAITYFFDAFVDLINRFDYKEDEIGSSLVFPALWEDNELCGFSPILKFDEPLHIPTGREPKNGYDDRNDCQVRMHRILVAATKIVKRSIGSQKWIFFDKMRRKFYTTESKKQVGWTKAEVMDDSKGVVCEVGHNKIDMQSSSPVEDEEVILFKPIMRHNSAPLYIPETSTNQGTPPSECFRRVSSLKLPQNKTSINPSNFCSNITTSSYTKTLWQEPIPEESVMDSFPENSIDSPRFGVLDTVSDGLPSPAGPPSLNAWVLNGESTKYGSRGTEDIASACITDFSIGETPLSQNSVRVTSSAPASHFMHDLLSWGDPAATIQCIAPPQLPPQPSAPLMPDDATWFRGDLTNDAEPMGFEAMKQPFLGSSQINCYLSSPVSKGEPKFDPNSPIPSNGYRPFSDIMRSSQWLHHYQDNFCLDRTHDRISPLHGYPQTPIGRIHDHDLSNQFRHFTPFSPGYVDVNEAGEHQKERLFHGYQRPSPHVYGAATDMGSEQLLLLQYLKEKEWHLQREAQLRGSS